MAWPGKKTGQDKDSKKCIRIKLERYETHNKAVLPT